MPEAPEILIMSNYINRNIGGELFEKIYHVEKGNIPKPFGEIENFYANSDSNGKELILYLNNNLGKELKISVFMGMSGNWKLVPTDKWSETKFVRMRLDSKNGNSLILHGGYMGPKYRIGGFKGVKRGPDIIKKFDYFKFNITQNINDKVFAKPICEVLLNQKYFNGVGNYIRSTILYYMGVNPFESARDVIMKHPQILQMCKDVIEKSYRLNGGQLKDWKNPFDVDSKEFKEWVFYKKGISCKDNTGRTFWYSEKWKDVCPY